MSVAPVEFLFATGIECSAPRIASGGRHDQLIRTGHWERSAEDLRLVRELGIHWLRYGIPFHVVAAEVGRFDWTWTDRALGTLRDEGLEPIADLLHFAVPDDVWGIGDPSLPDRFVRYVEAFVSRYPWIRWYTPVNEPLITALMSGKRGWWNERGTTDASFVAALERVVECNLRAAEVIRAARPDARFLQSDGCEAFRPAVPEAAPLAAFLDEQKFVGFDLTLGREPSPSVVAWLDANGVDERRLAWFLDHAIDPHGGDGFVVGLDYYDGNERLVAVDGSVSPDRGARGFAALAREFAARYDRPIMLAETNQWEPRAEAWLASVWADGLALLADGLPFVGFCWYSLTDQVDWDVCLREDHGRLNPLGLVDLDRRLRPVGRRYAELATAVAQGRFEPLVLPDEPEPEPEPEPAAA